MYLPSDLFWIDRGWHPVCPTICVMFLASHQALLSGNRARRLMCAGGAAEYSASSAQQIRTLCHMTAPKGAHTMHVCTLNTHLCCYTVSEDKHAPTHTHAHAHTYTHAHTHTRRRVTHLLSIARMCCNFVGILWIPTTFYMTTNVLRIS